MIAIPLRTTTTFPILCSILLSLPLSLQAFHPMITSHSFSTTSSSSTGLFATSRRDVVKQAIKDALTITQQYGSQSSQAQIAWELAEEVENSVYSPCAHRADLHLHYDPDVFDDECPLHY